MCFARLAVPVVLGVAVYAQGLPDGDRLLQQVSGSLGRFDSIQFVTHTTVALPVGGRSTSFDSESAFAASRPGKTRIESKAQGASSITVSNGKTTLIYNQAARQYTKIPGALGSAAMATAMAMGVTDSAQGGAKSRTVRDETIEIEGQSHDCWVVESEIAGMTFSLPQIGAPNTTMTGTVTLWIDKKLAIDVKSESLLTATMPGLPPVKMVIKTSKSKLNVNETIADSTFEFTPPPDTEQVAFGDLLSPGAAVRKTNLIGKEAPPFELKGLDGKLYSLASLKGKPVVLDFWATWCVPCRASLPILDEYYRMNGERGVVVLGVNVAEEPEAIKEFLKETPIRYPAALTGASGIVDAYQVTVYPTLVFIGPDGKIKSYELGFGGDAPLRRLLQSFDIGPSRATR